VTDLRGPGPPNPRGNPSPCDLEPIHIPGAIQPHGALLAALADSGAVTHASANLSAFLGIEAETVLGRPLAEAVGAAAYEVLMGIGVETPWQMCSLPGPDGGTLHLNAHRSGQYLCVDIENLRREAGQRLPVAKTQSVIETFRHTDSRSGLCRLAVRGLKAITGYDRVMAYRFGADGHGEVIEEACAPHLEPYLGLRYPASDVPPQARRLYLRQRVGAIADSAYIPVPLLTGRAVRGGEPLDLTHSALRSVSPVHREYMRNMGTAASLTIGLAQGEALWGMLVCHHGTPRVPGPEMRAGAEMIGQVVSLLLVSLAEAEVSTKRYRRGETMRHLVNMLSAPMPLPEALAAAEAELLQLMDATGAMVRTGGASRFLGRTPPPQAAEMAFAALAAEAGGDALAVDSLGIRHEGMAGCTADGSGALFVPFARGSDSGIVWFRPELVQTVTWGGNPSGHVTVNPATGCLSPRASFAAWKETVRGRSAPWSAGDLAIAREFRSAVASEAAQRTKAELALLRHYDPLTGLPNRSLLKDRLEEALRDPGTVTALLFLDLDRFKAVNDTMGHAAGDALLVEVARRLQAAAGPENLAARLGGDEFVVLCRGMDREAVAALGERVRQEIALPFEIAGRTCHVSASIGMAADGESGGLDLVRAADMAMYAAKQCGGNRGMVFEKSLYDHAAQQFELDQELREALSGGDQLSMVYQPVFRQGPGKPRLAGFEALLRWRNPRLGCLPPELFVPMAEKSGLILPLGEWALTRALRDGALLRRECAGLLLAVNISAAQLGQPSFCSGLESVLQSEGFEPSALVLEVTESMLADTAASFTLANVRKLGLRVAIDDFGKGYSSLSYILTLPVDVVKLDRGFLLDNGDVRRPAFVSAVVALAHAAGMSVVAEGIETQDHLDAAIAAGADAVQGFFFSVPLQIKEAAALAAMAAHRMDLPD
jgi:diguanylate cyclase (GGDEF)-like protein